MLQEGLRTLVLFDSGEEEWKERSEIVWIQVWSNAIYIPYTHTHTHTHTHTYTHTHTHTHTHMYVCLPLTLVNVAACALGVRSGACSSVSLLFLSLILCSNVSRLFHVLQVSLRRSSVSPNAV